MRQPTQPRRAYRHILDTKSLLMRAYHGCDDTHTPTRGEAGFAAFLERYFLPILEQGNTAPVDVVATWDGGNGRRIALYPQYKEKRRTDRERMTPEKLSEAKLQDAQLEIMYRLTKNFLAATGAVQARVEGVEGDDLIAYISRGLTSSGCAVYTGDQDLLQLESDHCSVVIEGSDSSDYEERVPARLMALYKSIVGDSSDGYPGIKGMGPKKWDDLVEVFGIDGMEELDTLAKTKNIQELKEIAEESGDKNLLKIAENRSTWLVMYEVARLHPEWCEQTQGSGRKRRLTQVTWVKRLPNRGKVRAILDSCGALDLLQPLERFLPVTKLVTADNVEDILYNPDNPFMDDFGDHMVPFDYETVDVNKFQQFKTLYAKKKGEYVDVLSSKITGAGFTWGANYNKTIYISTGHKDTNNCSPQAIKDCLEAAGHDRLICHNAAFEGAVTAVNFHDSTWSPDNLVVAPVDTQIMASYVNENQLAGLKASSNHYLSYKQDTYKETLEAAGAADMSELTGEQVLHYGADDPICTAHLWVLWDLILQVEGTADFMYARESLTTESNIRTFLLGDNLDLDALAELQRQDQARLDTLWPQLRANLQEHCTTINDEATAAYMSEVKPYLVASLEDAGKSSEAIKEKLSDTAEAFRSATVYAPYELHEEAKKWIPSKKGLAQAVAWAVKGELKTVSVEQDGHREGDPLVSWMDEHNNVRSVYPPPSPARARITEFHCDIMEQNNESPLPSALISLAEAIAKSCHQFKVRQGQEYEELLTLVQKLRGAEAMNVYYTGDELNLGSWIQNHQLLFGKLGLPIRHHTKVDPGSKRDQLGFGGAPAANDKAIEYALAEDCNMDKEADDWRRDALLDIREIKHLQTMFSLYYDSYPLWVRPDTHRAHPQIRNCGTKTRRPTGTAYNKLQIKKGPVRQVYLPSKKGHIIVAFDFSGQELRLLASVSEDPALLDAYLGTPEKDVHSLTGSAIATGVLKRMYRGLYAALPNGKMSYARFEEWRHGDDPAKVEAANIIRNKRAKATNFGYAYEVSAGTVSTGLLIPRKDAQGMLDDMGKTYPGVLKFHDTAHKHGEEWGYVSTAYGNRRHMTDDILSRDDGARMRMGRQASNFQIQGVAADILKMVVSGCMASGLLIDLDAYIISQVYDELLCSVPEEHVVEFCQRLKPIMDITPPGHKVPMVAEGSLGYDWYRLSEFGRDVSEGNIKKHLVLARKLQEEKGGRA